MSRRPVPGLKFVTNGGLSFGWNPSSHRYADIHFFLKELPVFPAPGSHGGAARGRRRGGVPTACRPSCPRLTLPSFYGAGAEAFSSAADSKGRVRASLSLSKRAGPESEVVALCFAR
ncbi:hypothetical protein AAFF_G00275130 [Aldrovandia affinis]|uniref:Uncharacterized protein n=1 Tax=Aldrovandia affinis TaxID=143900 RepID=A0AAD7SS60_9TELE|nr:hypothetical protein AAFF_G00275130 [Aldrovandia affinis]